MRVAAVLTSLLVLGILSPLPWAGPAGATAREWVVSGPEDLYDQIIYLEENLTVAAGGRLALDNVTVLFNSTEGSPLLLEVLAGGELVLRNSTLNSNGSGPYLVRALAGSKLTVSGCTVSHAGTCATEPALSGFLVATDLSYIDGSTFRDGAAGMYLWDASPTLPYCRFISNDIGAVLDGSDVELLRCRFDNSGGLDILAQNGSKARAEDPFLDIAGVSVAGSPSSLDIYWSLTVKVAWDDGRPAAGAMVSIRQSDGTAFQYQADNSGVVAGKPVRSATILWNGTLEHGPFNISAESEGMSAWNLTDIDSERDVRLILDGTAPQLVIDYPPDGASLNGTPLPATGTAWDPFQLEDRPGVSVVDARIDDGQWDMASGTGSWSFGLAGLSEGFHTLTVRARDLAGNSNQSSVSFEVDITAPTLEVWPPAGHLASGRNVTVRIVTDGETVLFNGTRLAGNSTGGPLEVDWPLDSEGDNRAAVESVDVAGNAARAELRVVRDTNPPEVRFTSPPAFSVTNTSLVTVTGLSSDLHGVVLVEWGPDRENWTRVDGTSEWSFPALLEEGLNTIYVRATDGAGNAATAWLRLDLRSPDTTAPEIRILYPENGQSVDTTEIDVTARASDAGGIRTVQLSLDGTTWVNATGAMDWTGRLTLVPGNNTVRARAVDLAGNMNTTAVAVVYTPPPPDDSPPSLVLLYPPAGLKVPYGKLIVSGRASDPSGVSSVEISADGKRWTACVLAGEDWSGTVTLAPGTNTIRVRAADALGNRAESSTTAVYERPADPSAWRATLSLVLVLVGLALLAAWMMVRSPSGRQGKVPPPGSEEE